jgi:hypothetical protein
MMIRTRSLLLLSATVIAQLASCTDEASLGTDQQDLAGGHDDTTAPASQANVIVELSNGCTGTLITPTAVLTAKHCVCGSSVIDVMIGPNRLDGNRRKFRSTLANLDDPAITSNGPCPFTSAETYGSDLGVIFLDRTVPSGLGLSPAPVMIGVDIHRPTLIAPCAIDGGSCPDASGGTYSPALGVAGYGGGAVIRQVGFASQFEHQPGHPDNIGQYWTSDRSTLGLEPGDSGGALFAMRLDAGGALYRDVIGVNSAKSSSSNYWTDITRGSPRDWLVVNMRDNDFRHTDLWKSRHPNRWRGELDYLGPCQFGDTDCDHFFDAGDNCPLVFNPDQFATLGVETGDACNGPPPATPPSNCTATLTAAPDEVTVRCTSGGFATQLRLDVNGSSLVVASQAIAPAGTAVTYVNHPLAWGPNLETASYRMCSTSLTSQQGNCSPTMSVSLPVTPSCSAWVGCDDDVILSCAALAKPITWQQLDLSNNWQTRGSENAAYTATPYFLHPGNPYADTASYRVCNTSRLPWACSRIDVTLPHTTCVPPPPPPTCRVGYHWCGERCVPSSQFCE